MATQRRKSRHSKRQGAAPRPVPEQVSTLENQAPRLSDADLRSKVDRLVDQIEASRTELSQQRDRLEELLRERRAPAATSPAVRGTVRRGGAPSAPVPLSAPQPSDATPPQAPGEGVQRSFAEFLSEIGEAYARAQAELDRQSATYLATGSRPLPSVFRIPKLSATMKFALEKQGTKGMNLVFYSSKGTERELNQQSIEFEMVAAPPPPGLAVPVATESFLGPRWDLLPGTADRRRILDAGDTETRWQDALGLTAAEYAAAKPRIVLWRVTPPPSQSAPAAETLHLASYCPDTASSANLALALTRENPETGAVAFIDAQPLARVQVGPAGLTALARFLAAGAAWQAAHDAPP